MRILIAAPDRDFLTCYQKVLELEGFETATAFDGFQVMAWLQERSYDFVILDRSLPRVGHDRLIKLVNEMEIPVIVLQTMKMDARLLLKDHLANAYLRYPFQSKELLRVIKEVSQKRQNEQVLRVGDVNLNTRTFLLSDKLRITNEEIDILEFLAKMQTDRQGFKDKAGGSVTEASGEKMELPVRHGLYYVNALNQKFEKLQKKVRIQYEMNKGYGLVDAYE